MPAVTVRARPGTFTWAWCRQRALFWLPCALVFGIAFGIWHAASMNAWRDLPKLGLVASIVCIVTVSAGRLAACLARRQNLSRSREQLLVIAAILAGFLAAYLA